MAVPVVTFSGTKAVTADSVTNWSAGTLDTDSQYENTGSVGLKVSASTGGYHQFNADAGDPFSFQAGGNAEGMHIWAWLNTTGGLDTLAAGGLRIRIVDDAATDAVGEWYVGPPTPYGGGWQAFVIDPSLDFDNLVAAGTAGWATTSPPLAGVDGFGGGFKVLRTVSGNIKNTFVDAISVGLGYRVTNGDGASADATFDDIIAFEVITTNRYGAIGQKSGVVFPLCKLYVGFASGAGDTVFTESDFVVIWESARVATGFYEFAVQKGSGSTVVTLSNGSFAAVSPTEVYLNLKGGTTVTLTNVSVDRAYLVDLDGAVSWSGGTIKNSGTIDLGGAPTLTGVTVLNPTDVAALNVDAVSEMASVSGLVFDGAGVGGAGSCAIKLNLGSGGDRTVDLSGITFQNRVTNSHDVLIAADVVGHITINVAGGDVPTVNDLRTPDDYEITSGGDVELTGLIAGSEVDAYVGTDPSTATLVANEESTGTTYTFSQASGGATGYIVVFALGYLPLLLPITYAGSNVSIAVQQTADRQYENA